jgi:hypothetical protein
MYEVDETRGALGRQKKCVQGFGGGDLREIEQLEDFSVDGILKWIFKA